MPHPLLETDICECMHKGRVVLNSSTKDLLDVENSGVITIDDLSKATILGCMNNIAGIPMPCTKLLNIPQSITSQSLNVNGQKVVIAEFINQITTDKGSPLILQGEAKAKGFLELDE